MKKYAQLLVLILLSACAKEQKSSINIPSPNTSFSQDTFAISKEDYYDKVLGALVGSAIGDAMGASTEMWHRDNIQLKYGYITNLTPALRVQSPEGTWEHNLPAGATTDDTRWKMLATAYLTANQNNQNAENFVDFILSYYQQEVEKLNTKETFNSTDFLDDAIEKIDWIKEWARVAQAYKKGTSAYLEASNRFYGGEMSCAGQLYTPMFGLWANSPEEAYVNAYAHSIFDIGYAKDISGLVAALTNKAMRTQNIDSLITTTLVVDPLKYQDSRLVGRISAGITETSLTAVLLTQKEAKLDSLFIDKNIVEMPNSYPRTELDWAIENMLFLYLEENEKAIAFHSGEIYQILITALKYADGDFEKCMQFIVNYGRDNDTVAAVAGTILGAMHGYKNLPKDLKNKVIKVNKEIMGIDLEVLASKLTQAKYQQIN
ncbi:hypothetical protein GCM10011414_01640 [Croceivirga lutea]|uniref:ADP-ribosylglycohydrolase family protein n=1 Tax=Croceivirga lutea TaxID=1775167 RepID=UPI00163A7029|nr:ADP-ribosylglycohydrolase family protein [Croceivirga lutea]GGG35995.1 hypothetical protein GCM10011414_01640 [Croceivirga lutea]